jgi:hypothetical protein
MIWVGRVTTFLLVSLLTVVVQKVGVHLIRAETSYSWREAVGCLLVALAIAMLGASSVWVARWFEGDK